MDSCVGTLAGGLPHSDIHGSKPARGSPWLFAACHVLRRLLVPRHPPNALLLLDIHPLGLGDRSDPSRTGAIHTTQFKEPEGAITPGTTYLSFSHTWIQPDSSPGLSTAPLNAFATASRQPGFITPRLPVRLDATARPEAHQNLIHTDKDHTRHAMSAPSSTKPPALGPNQLDQTLFFSTTRKSNRIPRLSPARH